MLAQRWPVPAQLLLLLLLAGSGSALLSLWDGAEEEAHCRAEPAHYIAADLPAWFAERPSEKLLQGNGDIDLMMSQEKVEHGLADEAERDFELYVRNFTGKRRACQSMFDKVDYLGPLVVPRLKLAFCYVPKVACTQFKDLMNNLNGMTRGGRDRRSEGFGHNYLDSKFDKMRVTKENMTKANGWKFATFTRDPALRYLSSFGSTCVASDQGKFEHDPECCGPLVKDNKIPAWQMRMFFDARVAYDELWGVVARDDHWVSQTEILQQCGWDLFKPSNLDFHGNLSGNVNAQVKAMLQMVDYKDDALVDRLFPEAHVAGHRNPIHQSARELYLSFGTLQRIKNIYQDDYANFPNIGCGFTDRMLRFPH